MRIAQVAPPFEAVPPSRYGGTERVISTLTEELVRRGHEVTLFASGDSRTSARLVPTVDRALWRRDRPPLDVTPYCTLTLGKVLQRIDDFDVVHSHLDVRGFPLARAAGVPVVTTLHGRLDLPDLGPIFEHFVDVPLVSISNAQRLPAPQANWVGTVHHGLDLDEFTPRFQRGEYFVFLGRISPEKGLDSAIRVARRVGIPLKVAARPPLANRQDPAARVDWEYYEQVIQPLLADSCVELIGEVGGRDKEELLRNAAALLFPIDWPEPFGLVMIEALACGTPVLALRRGSVPEVLRDGVTGFACSSEDELVRAVERLDEIDRSRCRQEAEQRFSASAMADAYERVYERLVDQPGWPGGISRATVHLRPEVGGLAAGSARGPQ